jgi:hypothetical protein
MLNTALSSSEDKLGMSKISASILGLSETSAAANRRAFDNGVEGFARVQTSTYQESMPPQHLNERAKAYSVLANICQSSGAQVTQVYRLETNTSVNELDLITRKTQVCGVNSQRSKWLWLCYENFVLSSQLPLSYSIEWTWQQSPPPVNQLKVLPPPQWYQRNLAALRKLPPPTLSEVDTQMRASAEARRKSTSKLPASPNGRALEV